MKEYHKIHTIFKRDVVTHKIIEGEYSLEEFEYLKNNKWVFTEKVDGTNIRVMFENGVIRYGGKTDNASMPVFLMERLQKTFSVENLYNAFVGCASVPVCLYGEGCGAKIQKGGGNYNQGGVDFVLFDVWVDGIWLNRGSVKDIAEKLHIDCVPVIGEGTLDDAVELIRPQNLKSVWGDFMAEGLVARPAVELLSRRGGRIITKLKLKDF